MLMRQARSSEASTPFRKQGSAPDFGLQKSGTPTGELRSKWMTRIRLFLVAHDGLIRSHLRCCRKLTELRQSFQTWCFSVAGAAAGVGYQGSSSKGNQGQDANHGSRFLVLVKRSVSEALDRWAEAIHEQLWQRNRKTIPWRSQQWKGRRTISFAEAQGLEARLRIYVSGARQKFA